MLEIIAEIAKRAANVAIGRYIDLFADTVRTAAKILGVDVPPPFASRQAPIDKRIARLEVAKSALSESLEAIEELQREAERRKREHQEVLGDLETTLASKADAEKKLEAVQRLMDQDVEAFQTLAGVTNVRRERMIGFASGVAASIIASIIYSLALFGARRVGWLS